MEKVRAAHITYKALQTRKKYLSIGPYLPICPYVLAESMGFDLRFVNIPSFEGMYVASEHLILISAERPEGRKRFSCAHEIGHHVLEHGTVIDEILESGSDKTQEQEADLFASIILMPSSAVKAALNRYGKEIDRLENKDIYILSKYFGVSYQAFITHIHFNLGFLGINTYQNLSKAEPKKISASIYKTEGNRQIVVAGQWWQEKAIDIEVDDIIIVEGNCEIDGPKILVKDESNNGTVFRATFPGITRIHMPTGWCSFVKISRHKFCGMYQYRYEEEDE